MNKRRFDIVEIEGEYIYNVKWDIDDEEIDVEIFDNYIDALHQFEHLQKLGRINVELGLQLLPLPKLLKRGGNND